MSVPLDQPYSSNSRTAAAILVQQKESAAIERHRQIQNKKELLFLLRPKASCSKNEQGKSVQHR
ncbi:hypothetical protein M3223_04200 [Paenibacillus pasadenensis]|nr:hypothetical protein [Paenibacillus pasadenensis]